MTRLAYTIEALAAECGKSESYIRQLIRDNYLPAKRLGKSMLVLTEDWAAFLDSLPDVD
ncbi:hypothetical protein ACFVAJ_11165 [Agromyces sp. NPDC057679]|uniref:hypothetical protein n=1 Tax=Agromyces sp. NPDC057679 TaxID=3346207 RepID=UPI00366FD6D5